MRVQSALQALYPPRCVGCGDLVDTDFGLCPPCWRDTPFIGGTACDQCGAPVPGESPFIEACDDCLRTPRAWKQGRAALLYEGRARQLVMALKHSDRQEIAKPAGLWMHQMSRSMTLSPTTLVAPIPLHWTRLLKRRYNQAALLAQAFAQGAFLAYAPELLQRPKRTRSLEGRTVQQRFETVSGAICVNPRQRRRIIGRDVLIVDDVMASGATLQAAAVACLDAGAAHVNVLVLARAVKGA